MIKFRCQFCNRKIGVQNDYAGKRARCPHCTQIITIPRPQMIDLELYKANENTQYSVFICNEEEDSNSPDINNLPA